MARLQSLRGVLPLRLCPPSILVILGLHSCPSDTGTYVCGTSRSAPDAATTSTALPTNDAAAADVGRSRAKLRDVGSSPHEGVVNRG